MRPDARTGVNVRIEVIRKVVGELERLIEGEALSTSDRRYLGRCFDLLRMEIAALDRYVEGLTDRPS
jgi:hypothetical protein